MTNLNLLIDLHAPNDRQGIGSDDATSRAFELTGIDASSPVAVADLGCGTGAASLVLARDFGLRVTALDLASPFIEQLNERARAACVGERISAAVGDMGAPPLEPGSLDLIWSEGAMYNIGFETGAAAWRELLRPGGVLAVSDLVWTGASRPADVQAYWDSECPGVGTPGERIAALEHAGYEPIAFFMLSDDCWSNYLEPLSAGFDAFLERHGHSDAAKAIVKEHEAETRLREQHARWYGYAFLIARKPSD